MSKNISSDPVNIRTVKKELKIKYKNLERQAKETIKQMKATQKELDRISKPKEVNIVKKKGGRKSNPPTE